jgi:hypothetical protein
MLKLETAPVNLFQYKHINFSLVGIRYAVSKKRFLVVQASQDKAQQRCQDQIGWKWNSYKPKNAFLLSADLFQHSPSIQLKTC